MKLMAGQLLRTFEGERSAGLCPLYNSIGVFGYAAPPNTCPVLGSTVGSTVGSARYDTAK